MFDPQTVSTNSQLWYSINDSIDIPSTYSIHIPIVPASYVKPVVSPCPTSKLHEQLVQECELGALCNHLARENPSIWCLDME